MGGGACLQQQVLVGRGGGEEEQVRTRGAGSKAKAPLPLSPVSPLGTSARPGQMRDSLSTVEGRAPSTCLIMPEGDPHAFSLRTDTPRFQPSNMGLVSTYHVPGTPGALILPVCRTRQTPGEHH